MSVYMIKINRYFYFNTRTQESFWEQPKILGSDEVPLTPRSQVIVDQLFAQADQQQGDMISKCNNNNNNQ